MELRRYLAILRRHLVLVVITVAVSLAVGWSSTSRVRLYSSQTTLFIGSRAFATNSNTNLPSSDPIVAAQFASLTYAKMIVSLPTATAAIRATGIARSPAAAVAETTATAVANTTLIHLQVVDTDPQVAVALANAEASAFVEEIKQLEPDAGTQGVALPAYVFETASSPTAQPLALRRNLELAAVFGALVAVALTSLSEYVDVTVRGAADAQARLELPVLGAVPLQRVRG